MRVDREKPHQLRSEPHGERSLQGSTNSPRSGPVPGRVNLLPESRERGHGSGDLGSRAGSSSLGSWEFRAYPICCGEITVTNRELNKQSFLHKHVPFHVEMTGDSPPLPVPNTHTFSYVLLIPGEVTLARTISGDCAGHESSQKLTLRRSQTPKYKGNYIDLYLYLYISIYKAIFINKIQ